MSINSNLGKGPNLFEIFHGIEGLGGEHFFSQARRVQFADAILQVVILIYVQPANGGAIDTEHDAVLAGRVARLMDAVIEWQD